MVTLIRHLVVIFLCRRLTYLCRILIQYIIIFNHLILFIKEGYWDIFVIFHNKEENELVFQEFPTSPGRLLHNSLNSNTGNMQLKYC